MTREEAKNAAKVMLAFANGEKIERYKDSTGEWVEVGSSCAFKWDVNDYRVKSKERFDPKNLKPFDRVLVINRLGFWCCDYFSHIVDKEDYKDGIGEYIEPYMCVGDVVERVIPFNEDTKHLVGTNKEAPEYYRYWEE